MRRSYLKYHYLMYVINLLCWNLASHANDRVIFEHHTSCTLFGAKFRPHVHNLENPLVSKQPFSYNLTEAVSEAEVQKLQQVKML